MKIPRVSSSDGATLASQYLVEELKHPTPNKPFATINDTHHTALRHLVELFYIINKGAEKKSTRRHNGRQYEVEKETEQGHS